LLGAENPGNIWFLLSDSKLCHWYVPLIGVPSVVKRGTKTQWGDDINHDFLSKDLMSAAIKHFTDFLIDCENYEKKQKKLKKQM